MRIGLFTDTYFPQVSGVATSIRTLKQELEKLGHLVFVFTTTDKDVERYEEWDVIRIPSVPFFAFKDRRVAYRGFTAALKIAERYDLDIIHTQTEFSLGILGKLIARELGIPAVHTYHTQYEDYVRYIANGKLIRPSMVRYIIRGYLNNLDGVICPSEIVEDLLTDYEIPISKRVIPTGIDVTRFQRPDIQDKHLVALREQLGLAEDAVMLLSLSRISYEKNIQAVIRAFPAILQQVPQARLIIAGGGPYAEELQALIGQLGLQEQVLMTGMIAPSETALYYKAADFFVSASTSETQGLTYLESLATGTPVIAHANPYLRSVINEPIFGSLFDREEDIAETVVAAIKDTPAMNPYVLEKKLYEISAENFGRKVYEYYLDLKIAYDFRQQHLNEDSVAEIFLKSALSLPKRFLLGSTERTAKILKASVTRLRNLGEEIFDD